MEVSLNFDETASYEGWLSFACTPVKKLSKTTPRLLGRTYYAVGTKQSLVASICRYINENRGQRDREWLNVHRTLAHPTHPLPLQLPPPPSAAPPAPSLDSAHPGLSTTISLFLSRSRRLVFYACVCVLASVCVYGSVARARDSHTCQLRVVLLPVQHWCATANVDAASAILSFSCFYHYCCYYYCVDELAPKLRFSLNLFRTAQSATAFASALIASMSCPIRLGLACAKICVSSA
ncbi:unnamed protein product [Trichogramma brassicae]|uniref:Uncharacterized protein n=1 Tax=Trichogramma brassicae TaxID=86971 RepID=A0A6H5I6J6_9HYME|nr:unnamed protein product [Trichogramma brassicae]